MTVHTFHINGLPQSGKTTILLGALERLRQNGVVGIYVAPTEDFVCEMRRRTSLPCCSFRRAAFPHDLPPFPGLGKVRAFAVDDCDYLADRLGMSTVADGITSMLEYLGSLAGPTQLIVANWRLK